MFMSSVWFRASCVISTLSVTLGCSSVEQDAIAQSMRESTARSIARVFDGATDDFQIQSQGGEILFATLEAEIYQTRGRKPGAGGSEGGCEGEEGGGSDGCTDTTITSGAISSEACSGGGSGGSGGSGGGCGDDDGGCGGGEGGPGGFCLQVVDSTGTPICWADRPVRPGWQRDPRLACVLPASKVPQTYTLRVALRGGGTHGGPAACSTTTYKTVEAGKVLPYLLHVTLRAVAPETKLVPASASNSPNSGGTQSSSGVAQ